MNHTPRRPAFVLREAVTLTLVGGAIAAMLLLAAARARRDAGLAGDFANLRALATAHAAYAADNEDRFGALSSPTFAGAAAQVWSILIERTGRADWLGSVPPANWIPHFSFSHMPLVAYLDQRLPNPAHISPADHIRQLWQADPYEGYESLPPHLRPFPHSPENRRWPFSTSYELPPAFWAPDEPPTITQSSGGSHDQFATDPAAVLGGRRFAQVAFPAQKVLLFDQVERHFGPRRLYFAYTAARVPLVLVDGSAHVRHTEDANRGWNPLNPAFTTRLTYRPEAWEPPTLSGAESDLLIAHYRFTRRGLAGRDFGGPEVP